MTAVRKSQLTRGSPAEQAESRRDSDRRPIETIVAAVEHLPAAKLEIGEAQTSANVRVGARVVARLDFRHGRVLVNIPADRLPTLQSPADRLPTLQKAFPSSRPTANGIVFGLADSEDCSEALASIRERVRVETFIWQARVASP